MNPTGVSCFTPTFLLNIVSVVHQLPVKTLKVDIDGPRLKGYLNVMTDVAGRSQGSFSELSATQCLRGRMFKRACEWGLRDPPFTAQGE